VSESGIHYRREAALVDRSGLLAPDEPAPYRILAASAEFPALLVCDHATNRIPKKLGALGLETSNLNTHMALDIGAAAVTEHLSRCLDIRAVLAGYSRLVVDCNRRMSDSSAFPEKIDGVLIPDNYTLGDADRRARCEEIYWPYHNAVAEQLTELEDSCSAPALIAIHSFTPMLGGRDRPWHLGILWDKDARIPVPLMEALRSVPGIEVGDNEPYSGKHPHDFTVDHHAEEHGLPHVSIELRQELIDTVEGAKYWGDILAEALAPILGNANIYTRLPTEKSLNQPV